MKLITCAGYYGTGSSAVTDLIDECDNVHDMGDYEFRFVQDPDGICDLEYHLVLNNHRHNSGYALKRYERNVKFLNGGRLQKKYNRFFGDKWLAYSAEYVRNLADVEYVGYWHQDLRDKGKLAYYSERALNKLMNDILHLSHERNYTIFMGKNTNYATFPGERFYEYTRTYIDRLFDYANQDHKEFVMADQLVPPSNVSRYLRFFNDLKVVCVDRDPRDLYLLETLFWHGTIIPHDVDAYCKWFRATRAHLKYEQDDPARVMRIHFEDLVYHYDEMAPRVLAFCGIRPEHHTMPKTRLIPEESMKNTRLYRDHPEYSRQIAVIEGELKDFLYENG